MRISKFVYMPFTIIILLSAITFLFLKVKETDSVLHFNILRTIVEIIKIDNNLDKNILLVRAGLIRHYNSIDDGFIDIEEKVNLLNQYLISAKGKDLGVESSLIEDLKVQIGIKEEIVNSVKSDIGVLRNSLMYYSLANEELNQYLSESVITYDKELDEVVSVDLPDINSKVIRIISNPIAIKEINILKDIDSLRESIKNIESFRVRGKLILYGKHLEVILNHTIEVDEALLIISKISIEGIVDKIQKHYLSIYKNHQNTKKAYQYLMYLFSLILVSYSAFLLYKLIVTVREMRSLSVYLRYQKMALDEHAIVSVTDRHGVIKEVNENFCKLFNVTQKEVIGDTYKRFDSGYQTSDFYSDLWNVICSGQVWRNEINHVSADCKEIWLEQTIMPFYDAQGAIYQYVSVGTDITSRKEAEDEIEFQAYHDVLTGLPNRRLLLDRLEQALSLCKHHNHYGAILFIDLDRFKNINDSLGHGVGDGLLQEVSDRVLSCIKDEDTVARLGGDEFVVLFPEISDNFTRAMSKLHKKAKLILDKINCNYYIDGHALSSSASMGIAVFPDQTNSTSEILQQADTALYKAKDSGRSCFKFFESSMQDEAEKRLLLEHDMRGALLNDEFSIFLQPQYDGANNLLGAEVLLRWKHPLRGSVPPSEFIPIAEETGFIIDIGEWVLEQSFKKIKYWSELYPDDKLFQRIAINVSPLQMSRKNFTDTVLRLIEKTAVDPKRIELEITEGMLIDNVDETIDKIKILNKVGVIFSIDDFGTGYSSLSYFNRLPISKIKIDQSFVRDININTNNQAIVQTIIYMAKKLRMNVIAEGVETKEELDCLSGLGCAHYQGYYFSKPLPLKEFEKILMLAAG